MRLLLLGVEQEQGSMLCSRLKWHTQHLRATASLMNLHLTMSYILALVREQAITVERSAQKGRVSSSSSLVTRLKERHSGFGRTVTLGRILLI